MYPVFLAKHENVPTLSLSHDLEVEKELKLNTFARGGDRYGPATGLYVCFVTFFKRKNPCCSGYFSSLCLGNGAAFISFMLKDN